MTESASGKPATPAPAPTIGALEIAERLGLPAPTPDQVGVIEAPNQPMLVVAGAGSGKTETMASRVVYLVANGIVEPAEILGLTFTRKAAGELSERIRRRLTMLRRSGLRSQSESSDLGLDRPTVSTYNAYAANLVADHALQLGLEPNSVLLGEAGQWQLAVEIVESWQDDLGLETSPAKVAEAIVALSAESSEHLVEPKAIVDFEQRITELVQALPRKGGTGPYADVLKVLDSLRYRSAIVPLIESYQRKKRERDVLDFSDQVAFAARLARDHEDVGALERQRYTAVLLDEYQDTSYAQLILLSKLFADGHPVTAVGDPHQSIYGWRGASAGGLDRFPVEFPIVEPDGNRRLAAVRYLTTSWRNDQAVLTAANVVSRPLRGERALVQVPDLQPRPNAKAGMLTATMAATSQEEAALVADFMVELRRGAVTPPTSAVLCRTRAQFPALEAALRARGLPVEVVGLGGLLDAPEVVDIIATLQVMHDPSRGDALMRLLTGARMRIGAADLYALDDWARELSPRVQGEAAADQVDSSSLIDALDAPPPKGWRSPKGRTLSEPGRDRMLSLAGLLRFLRGRSYLALPDLVVEVELALDLDIETAAVPGAGGGRSRHIEAFRDVAASYTATGGNLAAGQRPTLGGFLAWLQAARSQERGLDSPVGATDPTAVQILTIHASKGLEWDVVAVPGLTEGAFPSHLSRSAKPDAAVTSSAWLTDLNALPYPLRGDREGLPEFDVTGAEDQKDVEERRIQFRLDAGEHTIAEERRLAYVALTRARSHLLLSGAWWGSQTAMRRPSRFLTELVEAGLTDEGQWAPVPTSGETNPLLDQEDTATWPIDPLGERRPAISRAAQSVYWEQKRRQEQTGDGIELPGSWAAEAALLLAERDEASRRVTSVELPSRLSASKLVRLAADPDGFAENLRRPMPAPASVSARRGTAFHAWVERYFGTAALLDLDDLEETGSSPQTLLDDDLELMKERFLASEWAQREPLVIEADIVVPLTQTILNCRIDAVFAAGPNTPGAQVEIVDWKTGHPPTSARDKAQRELQLASYRLAWSRHHDMPLDEIAAAFYYVTTGQTSRPLHLPDEAELEAMLNNSVQAPGAH